MNTDAAEPVADPYAPPVAPLLVPGDTVPATRYYVVSAAKFWTLELVTFGLYGLYWMYQHWASIKRATKGDEWPVMRAIFEVFYVHSLTAEIDQTLRRAHIDHRWSPAGVATGAVVAMIAGRIFDRVPATMISDEAGMAVSLGLVAIIATFKSRIQLAANLACGDEHGRGNARFTGANIAWLAVFGLLWLLVAAGMMMQAVA